MGYAAATVEVQPMMPLLRTNASRQLTSSTSFANPAVTLARAASNTFAGIRPTDTPGFIVAQLLLAAAATALFRWLVPALPQVAKEVVVPHPESQQEVA